MKKFIKKIPIIGRTAKKPAKPFTGSEDYWKDRYDSGRNSGSGSFSKLAEFKAEILNGFVRAEGVKTTIEYGSGDGNQLKLADYPSYTGFDVSPKAIALCEEIFSGDATKSFKLMSDYSGETAELTLSLDVIYHLIEDEVFNVYMERLFDSSERFVIIYASNTDKNPEGQAAHVRHRKFTDWVDKKKPAWKLHSHIHNRYPFTGDNKTSSFADFYIFDKI